MRNFNELGRVLKATNVYELEIQLKIIEELVILEIILGNFIFKLFIVFFVLI